MTESQRKEFFDIRRALDGYVSKIAESPAEINANPAAIRVWKPGNYASNDVRLYSGIPYKCIQAHDSAEVPDWTPEAAPALWMQYHGTSKETARPWIAPTGAHDMYRSGEWMIWTDGLAYPCLYDTSYSPTDYPEAWGLGENVQESE